MAGNKRTKRPKSDPGLLDGRNSRSRWHLLPPKQMAEAVQEFSDRLFRDQSSRRTRYARNSRLFEGLALSNYSAESYFRFGDPGGFLDDDPRRLIRSAVQTARAEIYSKQKPKGQAQTSGADWKTRRKAQKLDKLHEGALNQRQGEYPNAWALFQDAGVEAAIQGDGPVKIYNDYDEMRMMHKQVPVCELYTDPAEGKSPRTLVQVSPIDVDDAIARFCHDAKDPAGNIRRRLAIEKAKPFDSSSPGVSARGATMPVRYVEIWRLPMYGEPGRTAIVIGSELMQPSEEWTAPSFPFVFVRWERHRGSPWSMGIAQEGERSAINANDLHERLLDRQRNAAGKRTFYYAASVDVEQLKGNDAETLIPVAEGRPFPQETVVPPFGQGEVMFADSVVRIFWDGVGVSQTSAAARREPGIDSGAAQRTLNDTKAGRQLDKAQNFEQAVADAAYQHVYRARELHARDPEAVLRWPGGRVMKEVALADCLIDDKDFSFSVAPASNLPKDPAGRQALVGELYASQIISQETYRQLLQWPDLEKELDISSIETEYIDSLIDKYLDADEEGWKLGDYESPEGFLLDKQAAVLRVGAAYFQAKIDKAPAFNTDLLRRYALELDELIKRASAAQAAVAAPPPGMPMPAAGAGLPGAPAPMGPPPMMGGG
jgi:hypothetical protein